MFLIVKLYNVSNGVNISNDNTVGHVPTGDELSICNVVINTITYSVSRVYHILASMMVYR